jgi:glutathione synthase/RimK-type ligase-like ATP-grasp enzyme
MKTCILYSNKSSLTGKQLKQSLSATRKRTSRRAKCDILVRWGSTESFPSLSAKRELNSLEAVLRTSNKLEMIRTLSAAGITIPAFNTTVEDIDQCKDSSGNCYIRNKQGVVRYGNDFNPLTDLYYTKPVAFKRREYRVHVFLGKVIGIYEKIPKVEGAENRPKLFKSDTCRFVRSDPSISRVDQNAQASCIAAVQALGLDFGGVDLIRTKDAQFCIVEVNSAPGLNSQMLIKYTQEVENYSLQDSLE